MQLNLRGEENTEFIKKVEAYMIVKKLIDRELYKKLIK